MENGRALRSQKTVPDNEEGTNNIENGGEMEEGAELRCQQTVGIEIAVQAQTQDEQTESVKEGENSITDVQAMFLFIKETLEEHGDKIKNIMEENRREMWTSMDKIVMDFQHRINQRTESNKDEVKIISERTHSQIQTSTEMVQYCESESFQGASEWQPSSFHREGDVKKPATVAIQEHAANDQGVVVNQEERISNSDNSTDEAEAISSNINDLERAETGPYGCTSSVSRSQEIYGDFSEIPKSRIESEDITHQWGGQSCVAQLQQQYGAEEVGQRQTTEFYDTNSEADCLQRPAVSATTYSEDRAHDIAPIIFTDITGVINLRQSPSHPEDVQAANVLGPRALVHSYMRWNRNSAITITSTVLIMSAWQHYGISRNAR
jgi:hypothetical protein